MHRRRPAQTDQAGFTLLELLITIAVLAIVLTIALPSFRAVIQNNRVTTQANEFQAALQFARSESLKRGRPVSVCASDTDTAADASLTCGAIWTAGWIAVVDDNGAGSTSVAIDEVLRRWPATRGGSTLTHNGQRNFARFLPDGSVDPVSMPTGAPPPAWNFTLTIPECTDNNARVISVIRTGRSNVQRAPC